MAEHTRRWVEETTDPLTGEQLVFEAATEAELDEQVAAWFGKDQATATGADEPTVRTPGEPDRLGRGPSWGRTVSRGA